MVWKKLMGKVSAVVSQEPSSDPGDARPADAQTNVVRLEMDMMLKGSLYDRPGGPVKQYGVTVDGATRVVTSGDLIDKPTYDALLRAGAVRSLDNRPTEQRKPKPDKRSRQTG